MYTLPSGERATETSALPGEVRGLNASCSILSVPAVCWLAFMWSWPSPWNSGSPAWKCGEGSVAAASSSSPRSNTVSEDANRTMNMPRATL